MSNLKNCPKCGSLAAVPSFWDDSRGPYLYLWCKNGDCNFELRNYSDPRKMNNAQIIEIKALLAKWWDELPRKKEDPIISELKDMKRSIVTILNAATDGDYSKFFKECECKINKIYVESSAGSFLEHETLKIRSLWRVITDNINEAVAKEALRRIGILVEDLIEAIEKK